MTSADPRAAWLRLTLTPGVGGESQRALLQAFGLPEQVFRASRSALAAVVPDALAARLLAAPDDSAIDAALAWAAEPDNFIVTLADPAYPRLLLQTADPPTLLYVKGRVELLEQPAVAIVGSRNPTPQGSANAQAFARALSAAGLSVVSGLALGIDTAAHHGGLQGAGSTIAVIGTGADRVYPARNRDLARQIAVEGVLLSEFALGTPPLAGNFPRRNRVISGLVRAVLVVEAAERSGSLITARFAAEQGRDVFAIPGSIHSPLSKGCHRLIKDGAKLVEAAEDVLAELGLARDPGATSDGDAADRHGVLAAMGYDPCEMDALVQRTGLTPGTLSAMLLELELAGRIASLPGGRVQRLK